jgi:hypothetical protein
MNKKEANPPPGARAGEDNDERRTSSRTEQLEFQDAPRRLRNLIERITVENCYDEQFSDMNARERW